MSMCIQMKARYKIVPLLIITCFETVFLEWEAPSRTVGCSMGDVQETFFIKRIQGNESMSFTPFVYDMIFFLRKQLYFR